MDATDSKMTFIVYMNFVRINKEMKSLAVWVKSDLKFDLVIEIQEAELNVVKSLKIICDQRINEEPSNFCSTGSNMKEVK
jgi:hypothetical protein